MQRYLISQELKEAIKESPYSLCSLTKTLGFNVKNIFYYNKSINQEHLLKLSRFLELQSLSLDVYERDYAKNLGILSYNEPIKNIQTSSELAEFMGIMLGDGNIYHNVINVSCDKRWPEYIYYVYKLFQNLFGIHFKTYIHPTKNVVYLYRCNKAAVETLLSFGLLRGDKIVNNIGIPAWIKDNVSFAESCIRGLIDTDGCVYFCKREQKHYVGFTNFDKQLFQDFKEVTLNLGYSFARGNARNVCLYRKDHVAKLVQTIKPLKAVRAGLISSL